MVYSPRIGQEESQLLRRLSWGVGTYMTTTLKQVLQIMPRLVDCKEVCEKCRDKTICKKCREKSICKTCAFNRDQEHDQFHLTLLIDDKKIRVRQLRIIVLPKKESGTKKETV